MRKKDLVKLVAEKSGKSMKVSGEIVELVFSEMSRHLTEDPDGRIDLRGFATITRKRLNPRVGRNPRTGEPVDVPARFVLRFTASKEVREKLKAMV